MTQAAVAEQCHCHPTTISQIESGRMTPSLVLFAALCRVLKVSPSRLLAVLVPWRLACEGAAVTRETSASVTDIQKEREKRDSRN